MQTAKYFQRRVLLEEAITQSGFASKLDVYRLGPLGGSNRVWFQIRTKPDVVLPESTERAVGRAVMHVSAVKSMMSDVVVNLKSVELLEIIAKDDGYFAVVGLRAINKQTVDRLVEATTHHVKESIPGGGSLKLTSPFQKATDDELAKGFVVRLFCKVRQSVPLASRMPGPSSKPSSLYPPVGQCLRRPNDVDGHPLEDQQDVARPGLQGLRDMRDASPRQLPHGRPPDGLLARRQQLRPNALPQHRSARVAAAVPPISYVHHPGGEPRHADQTAALADQTALAPRSDAQTQSNQVIVVSRSHAPVIVLNPKRRR